MKQYKKFLIPALVGIICVLLIADGVRRCSRQSVVTKVERDTVVVTDTMVQYYPKPVETVKAKTEYKWLTRVEHSTDTLTQLDSVLVEVPIESRHYHGEDYDAYISGYEPSLDSIFVYNETKLVTETITRMKPPNKLSLTVNAGIDYGVKSKFWQPFASGELTINNDKRLQLGIEGGMRKSELTNDFEPFGEVKMKLKIF